MTTEQQEVRKPRIVRPEPVDVPAPVTPFLWVDFRLVLLGAAALLILAVASEMAPFLSPFRLVLGLAFVLVVPGYCLTTALFPRTNDLESTVRAGMSFGLSVALAPGLAVVLDRLPWGIHPWPIVAGIFVETAVFMSVATWRRSRLALSGEYTPAAAWRPRPYWRSLSLGDRRIYMLLVGTLLLAGSWLIWMGIFPSPETSTTEFYILGPTGLAQDYPREATRADSLTVTIGIGNQERAIHSYRIEAWAMDAWSPGQRTLVATSGPIAIEPGQKREFPLRWRMPQVGNDSQVEFLLFLQDNPEPYRRLRLWLNVVG